MIAPAKVEFDLGPNQHGQRISVIREGERWTIKRGPADQRDDSYGLHVTTDQLRMIGQIGEQA